MLPGIGTAHTCPSLKTLLNDMHENTTRDQNILIIQTIAILVINSLEKL